MVNIRRKTSTNFSASGLLSRLSHKLLLHACDSLKPRVRLKPLFFKNASAFSLFLSVYFVFDDVYVGEDERSMQGHSEAKRRHGPLRAALLIVMSSLTWVLRAKLGSPTRAVSVLNRRAISPAPILPPLGGLSEMRKYNFMRQEQTRIYCC